MKPEPIVCGAGCKRQAAGEQEAERLAWERLPITGRWRCPACWRELAAVNRLPAERAR